MKRTAISVILSLSAAFFGCPLVGFPAEPTQCELPEDEIVVSVAEVTVTENRSKEIIKSQAIKGEDLARLNSQSVADALRYFSGAQVKDYGGIGGIKTINIRSMGSEHVGVYYDGVQLGNAQNGQIDLGRYSLDNIEAISLYNGQKSNIFQSAKDFGTAGSVYLTTRRPRWNGSRRTHLTLQLKAGSFGLVNPQLVWEQRLSRRMSLSVSSSYTHANGRYKFRYKRQRLDGSTAYDTTATRHNGDISALRAEVSLFGFLDNGSWSGKAYYYDSSRGIPGAIVNNVFRNGERQWDRNFFAQGQLELLATSRYHLRASGKWAWDYLRFLRDDPKMLFVDNSYFQQELYLSATHLYRITSFWDATLATDFQWNRMNANLPLFLFPQRFSEMVALASALRFGSFQGQISFLTTLIQDRAGNDHTDGRRTSHTRHFTPAIFLNWNPLRSSLLSLNAFYKRSMRMPTFNDLYYTEIGNKYLQPERVEQYSVGASLALPVSHHGLLRSVDLQANTYINRVRDKIVAYPSGQQFRWTMLNLGKVLIKGLDASLTARFALSDVAMRLLLNYTYQSARDRTDPADSYYGDQIPYVPFNSGSVAAMASWHGWELNYSFIYTGYRYNAQENTLENYEQPWYTSDLSLYRTFRLFGSEVRAGLEVNNLFNQDYEVIANYPMPGRNFKANLTIRI